MKYILVLWPESQVFMEYDWFRKECFLCHDNDEQSYSSAYFIPENRYNEVSLFNVLNQIDAMKKAAKALDIEYNPKQPYRIVTYLSEYWEQVMKSSKLNGLTVDEMTILSILVDEYESTLTNGEDQ